MIPVAVIGTGHLGSLHAKMFSEIPGAELVGVYDIDPERAARVAQEAKTKAFQDLEGLLGKVRAVSIATPTRTHADIASKAVRRRLHVFVEKPITATIPEAEALLKLAREWNVIVQVGHIERFNPAIRELSRRLDAGELGRVFQVRAARLGPFPARVRDVGVVVDLAPHDLDVMRYLLRSEPVRMYAETEQRIHTDHEDLFTGLVKFESGAVGLLEINWLTPTKVRRLTVTGERGMYEADYLTQDLVFYANPDEELVTEGEMTRRAVQRREPLVVELSEFVSAIRAGGPPPVTPHDALVAMLLARAMVDAAARGVVINVDDLVPILA